MTEFKSKTAKSVIPVPIKAPVDQVFPLACPFEEFALTDLGGQS